MKIAVIFNRESEKVINLFGLPNREKYGKKSIKRIVDGLKIFGHQVKAFEGDKELITNLEGFMPKVLKGELPGMAFNLSYGIQGQARYTHVPGILEMVGIPYVGSGPLAHSLALDKVVAKMIFRQQGLPTPDFAVLDAPGFPTPDLSYPLIVKPKNEAVSMGIKIVHNEDELRSAAQVIFDQFNQPVLLEQYIEGREINVGLLGNSPPEALPPCEIVFGQTGPQIYTIEDKKGQSDREIQWLCPAPIGKELTVKVKEIAIKAFAALGCYDCARVDMRLDAKGNPFILEINSLPSLGEHGSYVIAAGQTGLDFSKLVNRLVDTATARYFGTPKPPPAQIKDRNLSDHVFAYLSKQRDAMEKRLEEWVSISSRTYDPVGNRNAMKRIGKELEEIKMRPVEAFTDKRSVRTWETKAGFEGGTLFIGHLDVPVDRSTPTQLFRRDPEWLYGEGIGASRAPLVMLTSALRALRNRRVLHKIPLGVLYYSDEGRDCRYSAEIVQKAAAKAARVLVLRPGSLNDKVMVQRRGQKKYLLTLEGKSRRLGQYAKIPEVLLQACGKFVELSSLSSRKDRVALSVTNIQTDAYPMLLPHRVTANLMLSYLDPKNVSPLEEKMSKTLSGGAFRFNLESISDRPPMKERRHNLRLAKKLAAVADQWEIPLFQESSVWPSAGGLVPARVPVVCGVGPVSKDLYTPQEGISRSSFIQRTLLMAQFLSQEWKK
jgi:D-alanine-D-alanine ligase